MITTIWVVLGIGFLLGLFTNKYMENRDFKTKVNNYVSNLLKKKRKY